VTILGNTAVTANYTLKYKIYIPEIALNH